MNDREWKKMGLPLMSRAFQQHRLDQRLTRVCTSRTCERTEAESWDGTMRSLMLEHVPLGQSGLVRERKKMEKETKRARKMEKCSAEG